MGTTYKVVYDDANATNYKAAVDSLLVAINADVNTYDPNSIISQFNKNTLSDSLLAAANAHYDANFEMALAVAGETNGAFDPTIMPLVNYWGFGYTGKEPINHIDTLAIDSIMQFIGLDLLEWTKSPQGLSIQKQNSKLQLDFGGIAKGYALDKVGELLERNGVKNYMVEIGLEVKTKGTNPGGRAWTIGINTPKEGANVTDVQEIVQMNNLSVATSGNYRQSYEVDGRKAAHIINPKTGYPEVTNLLSASVFTENCALADAYATAFIVMGLDAAYAFAANAPELEALFIYGKEDGTMGVKMTPGAEAILVK